MDKTIVICCNVYPPKFIGGAELIAHDQAKILKEYGCNVIIFTGDIQGYGERHSIRRETYDGLTVFRIALTWEDFSNDRINFINKKVEEHFERILDTFSPDIVHFHNIIGLSVKLIHVAKSKGIRTTLTLHDHWGFCYKNTILRNNNDICRDYTKCAECMEHISDGKYEKLPIQIRKDFIAMQLQDVDIFITPSKYLKDAYVDAGFAEHKFRVVWNGIDVRRFAEIPKTSSSLIRFTFIGYFGIHKGIDTLIDAIKFIITERQFMINLVGDGELIEKYKRQVELNGFDKIVRFWGKIDNIEEAYSETDILILPSIWPENQPVTITEAMASKIPVIASNIGGIPEIVDDGITGYLFKPRDSRDLAEKMLEFIENPERIKHFGENAHERIVENTFENQVSRIIEIYNECTDRSTQRCDETIITCVGLQFDAPCTQALKILTNKYKMKLKFLLMDWTQEDQVSLAQIIWVVDRSISLNEIVNRLADRLPLLVPNDNSDLKRICIEGNCGLYYRDAIEAYACIEYLIENETVRVLLGNNGYKYISLVSH